MNVNGLFLRAASARGLGSVGACMQTPTRRQLRGLGTAKLSESDPDEPGYRPSMSSPPLVDSSSGEVLSQPGEWASWAPSSESGGGFFSALKDAAAKMLTGALTAQPTSYLQPVKEPSPWPWVVGGVAVAGLAVFALTRSRK